MLSSRFLVRCGVRQGGILSPILFIIYVNDLNLSVQNSGYGCYIKYIYVRCIMYAVDLLIMSPSVIGLQNLLDICTHYGNKYHILFNAQKICCIAVGKNYSKCSSLPDMYCILVISM